MKIPQLKSNMLIINVFFTISTLLPLALSAQADPAGQHLAYATTRDNQFLRPVNTRLNDIPAQAYRHLSKNYPQAREAAWSRVSGGYQARFQENGIMTQVCYDERGAFRQAIRYLEAGQADAELLKKLGRAFPGYQPDIISEINNECRIVYLITLKNQYSMKSVLYREGEFQLIDDLDYAGL